MNVLVVIQARLGSTRLLGKVLLPLGGKPVLQHVVERADRSGYPVVVGCPYQDREAILRVIPAWKVPVVVESIATTDVLGRFAYLAETIRWWGNPADIIVRLTADCPVLDPALIREAVDAVKTGHDYASNTLERTHPRGLDVESFTTELLQEAHQSATDPYDREHVTPWMQRNAVNPKALTRPGEPLNQYRWCLDTPSDYSWLHEAYRRFPDPSVSQLLTLPPHYD